MVRSSFIVVSDDQLLIQKAHQFGLVNGVTVKVMTPAEYEAANGKGGEVPSLVAGNGQTENTSMAKVLPFPGTQAYGSVDARRSVSTIDQLESVAIESAITAFKGNLTEAAKALGIGRATLYRKVKAYNLDPSAARKKKAA
ncbi:MAG: helix-turn-helix domain-containing protein [Bdellovibrionales bacterium]|jgi:DNA-binding NtrC family response regulator|nr:helix-turn-helix domain-containing protein [Bdellovibrionales bacterium]